MTGLTPVVRTRSSAHSAQVTSESRDAPVVALSIAGSDPSGGAGIQADLKTFAALGAYGAGVLTALTAQATTGVTGVHQVPAAFVEEQLHTLLDDVAVDAVKIGMLGDGEVVAAVAQVVTTHQALRDVPVVLDPVMVSTSGSRLLTDDAVAAMRTLLPHVSVITPNSAEAAVLLDTRPAADVRALHQQARALYELGARRVLVTGGHLDTERATDAWFDDSGPQELSAPRVSTRNTHGTGCTLSSALAALRPRHPDWPTAARAAKEYLGGALTAADDLDIGAGPGPVHHAWAQRDAGVEKG
ncbi:MAG: bifunctional hydroxymethylpyrimidine kinase/phosphomethylpyrimidine kinase [Dermatophilaceae bacterium]